MLRHLLRCFAIDRRSVRPRSSPRRSSRLECLEGRALLAATVYTVTNLSSSADISGSLPNAVNQADGNTNPDGSVIQFSQTVFTKPQTITLKSTLMLSEPYGPIVINGPGANLVTVSGNNTVGVFEIESSVTATVSGLTISGGASNGTDNGGGIVSAGTLTVTACDIANNSGVQGSGIDNSGELFISGCTIADNSSTSLGGGIFNSFLATATDCTIASNSALFGGGGIYNDSSVIAIGCTIADNSANAGGGIANSDGVILVNCTVAYNTASVIIELGPGGTTTPGVGGGLIAYATSAPGGGILLDNTIVALNTAQTKSGAPPSDIVLQGGTMNASSTHNLIGTGGSGGLVSGTNGNLVGVSNPGIAPLGNNGGPNQTIAEYLGGPAEGAGLVSVDGSQTTDGRGAGFPRLNNGAIDIGAYEIQPVTYTKIVKSTAAGWGNDGVAALQTAADGITLLPAGRKHDLPWFGIDSLQVTFDQPVVLTAADVTLTSEIGVKYGPVSIAGSGMSYTIMFARPIDKPDRVEVSISLPQTDTFRGRLNVLPGDFYDTGVVTSKDLTAIKNESTGKHAAAPTIFGDVLGNGTVNSSDFRAAKRFLGTRLPRLAKAGGYASRVVLARQSPSASSPFVPRKDLLPFDSRKTAPRAAPATVAWPSQVFAPYVDVTLYPTPNLSSAMTAGGIKFFTLGFVVADPRNHKPSWGGYPADDINGSPYDVALRAQVSAVRQQGGDVMISFGGQAGQELAQVITNVKQLENAYQTVINDYNANELDFDIEGAAELNHASIIRRFKALAALEQQDAAAGRPLHVSLTLPAVPTGLDAPGMYVVQMALKYGVKLAGINLMTMDYGISVAPNPDEMGQYAIQAAQGLFGQLQSLYGNTLTARQIWSVEGNTPMIGVNDVTSEVLTLADAQQLATFAEQVGMGRISMWSVSRDVADPRGALNYVENNSSSIVQQPYAFSRIFGTYED
jgi:chitinase